MTETRKISLEAQALHSISKASWAENRALLLQDELVKITQERDSLIEEINRYKEEK